MTAGAVQHRVARLVFHHHRAVAKAVHAGEPAGDVLFLFGEEQQRVGYVLAGVAGGLLRQMDPAEPFQHRVDEFGFRFGFHRSRHRLQAGPEAAHIVCERLHFPGVEATVGVGFPDTIVKEKPSEQPTTEHATESLADILQMARPSCCLAGSLAAIRRPLQRRTCRDSALGRSWRSVVF